MKRNQDKERKQTRKTRVKLRRETQFHRGGERAQRQPGREAYVHSTRKGKVRRDRDQSVEQLVIVLNRMEKRRKEDRSILRVGTNPELGRRRERMNRESTGGSKPKNRELVTRGWVSGLLTNYAKYATIPSRLGDGGKNPVIGKQDPNRQTNWKLMKELPGLILFRHPNDHGVGRKEARRCGIPTAGRVDSDCEHVERRTYPIPGNDDSRAAQRRLIRRVRKVCEGHKEGKKKLG